MRNPSNSPNNAAHTHTHLESFALSLSRPLTSRAAISDLVRARAKSRGSYGSATPLDDVVNGKNLNILSKQSAQCEREREKGRVSESERRRVRVVQTMARNLTKFTFLN